jgi:PAS domain S-box-containing protein
MKVEGLASSEELALAPFFTSPGVGVVIYDQGMRYRAVNSALAAMNGVAAEVHLGKMPHEVIGQLGLEFERHLNEGLARKEPGIVEFAGYLPTRGKKGHWINTFIPIRSNGGRTTGLFAMVLDVSEKRKFEDTLFGLTGRLVHVKENLQANLREITAQRSELGSEADARLLKSLELVEESAADIAEVLRFMRPGGAGREFAEALPLRSSPERNLPTMISDSGPADGLTPREREVLCMLACSESNKRIAARLGISVRTVESHRRRVMEKLQLHSVGELVHYAIRRGLVEA